MGPILKEITPRSLQTLLNLRTYFHSGPTLTNMCEITLIFKVVEGFSQFFENRHRQQYLSRLANRDRLIFICCTEAEVSAKQKI